MASVLLTDDSVIDLHMHTTASDGRCEPADLVRRAFERGIRTLSVTDHDTRAAEPVARAAAESLGMTFVAGIEITAVDREKDVHVLAYGLPREAPDLDVAIARQRRSRGERAREIGARLERLGAPIDVDALLAGADPTKAIARPQIAQCLVDAGHVASIAEAFDRFLGEQSPAYVPNRGISPEAVIELVSQAGGVCSLAHPGQLKHQDLIERLAGAGLPCLEVFHSSHDAAAEAHYLELAHRFGLGITGGSDYHGEGARRAEFFGVTHLPVAHYRALENRLAAARERAHSGAGLPASARI